MSIEVTSGVPDGGIIRLRGGQSALRVQLKLFKKLPPIPTLKRWCWSWLAAGVQEYERQRNVGDCARHREGAQGEGHLHLHQLELCRPGALFSTDHPRSRT